jgi:Gram-negative bacterial TonB protein C-terminal
MASAARIGSIARWTAFGAGALFLHAAAAWALPGGTARIYPPSAAIIWLEPSPQALPAPGAGASSSSAAGMDEQRHESSARDTQAAATLRREQRKRALSHTSATEQTTLQTAAGSTPAHETPAASADTSATAARDGLAASTGSAPGALAAAADGASRAASAAGASGPGSPTAGRGPALRSFGNPCTGYFPAHAHASQGEVQLDVLVDASGRTHASAVLAELPHGQGFAHAARECARRLQFAPAVSDSDAPMASHARLKLRFKRSAG